MFFNSQGIPGDGPTECVDSHRHMSVVVLLNSVEMIVDLMRFPGQLMPFSTKAVFTSHISAAGESDSAENDSCDSPLEPNSPLYGLSDKLDTDRLVIIGLSKIGSITLMMLNYLFRICIFFLVFLFLFFYFAKTNMVSLFIVIC